MCPSMRELFGHYHKMSEAERKDLWDRCTFVLDANVLLNIYRYEDATREDLFRVLENLKGRIWVPFQAAKEFYVNRLVVIREQKGKFDRLESVLDATLKEMRGGEFTKSAFLRIEDLEQIVKPSIEKAKLLISERRAKHPELLADDLFLERLVLIVGDSIGDEPEKKEFDESCKVAQERIDKKQPPGYLDFQKPIPDRYGDVLIWFELLKHAKSNKSPIVLVTDDDKEDWWLITGGQKLGPRPELREEMKKTAGVEFHILNPARFLELAADQLKLRVADSSVVDATNVAAEIREQDLLRIVNLDNELEKVLRSQRFLGSSQRIFKKFAIKAVSKWFLTNNPGSRVIEEEGQTVDLVFEAHDRLRVGVDVISTQVLNLLSLSQVKDRLRHAKLEIDIRNLDDYLMFLVLPNDKMVRRIGQRLDESTLDPLFPVSIGFLTSNGDFFERVRINRTSRFSSLPILDPEAAETDVQESPEEDPDNRN